MGNVGISSVGIENVNQTGQAVEQNVSLVSRGKALLARYSRDIAVSIWLGSSHSSHVQGTCFLSRDA